MTSLVTWLGVDSRGPASIYIASDSRISWDNTVKWDYGRKVFASQKHSIIMGFVGDALFPSQILSQITDLIDADLLCKEDELPIGWLEKIDQIIRQSFEAYPKSAQTCFEVVYSFRENEGMSANFYTFISGWKSKTGWFLEEPVMPGKSGIICLNGSGGKPIEKWHERWNYIDTVRGTSRAVFSAFCDALDSGEDIRSGGAPQLVALYRKGVGQSIGTIYKGVRYLFGLPISELPELQNIEWRNSIFERCDGQTMQRLEDAQIHKRPRGLARA
jgi:hypothetical protein